MNLIRVEYRGDGGYGGRRNHLHNPSCSAVSLVRWWVSLTWNECSSSQWRVWIRSRIRWPCLGPAKWRCSPPVVQNDWTTARSYPPSLRLSNQLFKYKSSTRTRINYHSADSLFHQYIPSERVDSFCFSLHSITSVTSAISNPVMRTCDLLHLLFGMPSLLPFINETCLLFEINQSYANEARLSCDRDLGHYLEEMC